MKKIIKIITIIMTFFVATKTCLALGINKGEVIDGIKIHIKTSENERNTNIYQMINRNTNELLYSITPNIIPDDSYYDDYNYYGGMNYLEENIKEKIARITYFGYGYKNRTDIKWYAITQYLIWEEILKDDGEIYFIDNENNKIDLYKEEREAILNDVAHFTDLPSFVNNIVNSTDYYIKLNEELIFEDTSNILKDFEISSSAPELEYKIEDNKVTITPTNPTLGIICFTKKIEELNKDMKIYINSTRERLISRGNINKKNVQIIISVKEPVLTIKNNSILENSISFENAEYEIHYENGDIYSPRIALNKNGISENYNIWPGKYYLVEAKAPYGFELNPNKIYFEIKKDDLTINITNNLIKKNITIEKHLINNNGEEILEEDAKINIYDKENNLIKELVTNNLGKASVELSYGTYTIIEDNLKGRNTKETLTFTVDDNFNEEDIIILKSNEIKEEITEEKREETSTEVNNETGSIIINKIDALTGKPLKGIKYALYNKDKEIIKEDVTNSEGKIIFKDLETGKYYIKEILMENDKELDENAIAIEVKNNIDTILTSPNRTEIRVPNTTTYSSNLNILITILIIAIGIFYLKYEKVK